MSQNPNTFPVEESNARDCRRGELALAVLGACFAPILDGGKQS
jgi:hypothetical protein